MKDNKKNIMNSRFTSGGHVVVPADSTNAVGGFRKKSASSRSWILMDSSGQEIMLDVDKYAIMHRVQIHARDLRILDPLLSYPSTILGRERAIVLNLEYIKAFITADEVLLRDPLDENVVPLVEDLQRRLKSVNVNREDNRDRNLALQNDVETSEEDDSPFEFRVLEVALESICSYLAARTLDLEAAVYPALDMLTSKTSSRNLDQVLKLKSQLTRLTARVRNVRDELARLLGDDDDMADLYLTRKLASASPLSDTCAASWFLLSPTMGSKISKASRASVATFHGEDDVEELAMLLEVYFMQIDTTLNKLSTLREYINNTEDYINIQLDNHRNQLIQLEPILTAGTLFLVVYPLVVGIFGMNIPYIWNDNYGYMFKWACICTGILCLVILVFVISYSRFRGLTGS